MSSVIKNPSPKTRFQESADNVKRHRDLIALREFERAADMSLLQYQKDVTLQVDANPQMAGAASFKMQGAQEFLWTFRNLAESFELPKGRVAEGNLDHAT